MFKMNYLNKSNYVIIGSGQFLIYRMTSINLIVDSL